MKLTDLLDQIQERSRTAGDHVARLCTKEDRWKMSVPVQDDDSDILLTQITDRDVPQLAKALRTVMDLEDESLDGDLQGYEIDQYIGYNQALRSVREVITDALGDDHG